jgi:SulP family sulfate permease
VIFDFRRVTGLDTSAAMSFMKIRQLADRMNFMLIFTAPPPELREQLGSWGFTEATQAAASAPLRLGLRWFDDLDHGLEWCEDQLLAAVTPGGATPAPDDRWDLGFPIDLRDRLHPYLEEMTVARGEELIHQGEKSDELYFIEAGQFSIRLAVAGGKTIRLRKIGPGTVLGELGLYLSETRSASVTADEMSTVLRLRASALERMQRTEPDLASAFHEFMARLLAERLLHTNKLLEAVLD